MLKQGFDGVEGGVYRPVPGALYGMFFAVNFQFKIGRLRPFGTGDYTQGNQLDGINTLGNFIIHQCDEVIVKHVFLAVGQIFETQKASCI